MIDSSKVLHAPTLPNRFAPRTGALASLSLVALLSSIGTSVANVSLPTLGLAFDVRFQQVQWVVLAYLLAATSLIVTVGRLGDLFGRRRVLLSGLLLFTIASVLCGSAPSLTLLITARAVQGLGAAIMMALPLALAREAVPDDKVGQAMGLLATFSAVGTALGPPLGGFLLQFVGWRAIFLVLVPAGVAGFLAVRRHLPVDAVQVRPTASRFDKLGALLLAMTLIAYAMAMTMGRGGFGLRNLVILTLAAVGGALFTLVERRATSPLVQLSLFRDRGLNAALAANVVVSSVLMSTLVIGPFYLFHVLELGSAGIGMAMAVGPSLVAILGLPAGQMADRFGGERISSMGLAIIVVGSLILALTPTSFRLVGYLVPIAVITIGYAMFQTSNNMVVLSRVPRKESGAMSGVLNLSRNLGLITGASVLGAVFTAATGNPDISVAAPEAVAAGMRTSFGVSAVMVTACFVAIVRSKAIKMKAVVHV